MPSYNLSAHSSFPTLVLHSVHSTQDMLPCWRSTSVLLSGSWDKGIFTVVFLHQRSAPCHSSLFPLSCPPHSAPLHKAAYFMCVQTHCCHAFGLECSTKHDCCFHRVAELAFKSLCQGESSWHTPHPTMLMNPALQTRKAPAVHQCLSTSTDASKLFIYRLAEHRTLHVQYFVVDIDRIWCS